MTTDQEWEDRYVGVVNANNQVVATALKHSELIEHQENLMQRKVPLSPVIKNLKQWREKNVLSQRQAVAVMSSRGFDVALTTLQAWEQGVIRQGHYAEAALRGFLEKYPKITDAPQYGRWANEAPPERLLEMKKLKADGATYAQIGEKFGVTEGRAWRILNGNQKRPVKPGAKAGRPKTSSPPEM